MTRAWRPATFMGETPTSSPRPPISRSREFACKFEAITSEVWPRLAAIAQKAKLHHFICVTVCAHLQRTGGETR